jgi:hypothetical protein
VKLYAVRCISLFKSYYTARLCVTQSSETQLFLDVAIVPPPLCFIQIRPSSISACWMLWVLRWDALILPLRHNYEFHLNFFLTEICVNSLWQSKYDYANLMFIALYVFEFSFVLAFFVNFNSSCRYIFRIFQYPFVFQFEDSSEWFTDYALYRRLNVIPYIRMVLNRREIYARNRGNRQKIERRFLGSSG